MTDESPTIERREFGSLRLRGRIWWLRYRIDGKEHWESSRSTSRKVAEKLLDRRAVEHDHDILVSPESRRLSFGDLETMILTDYRLAGNRSLRRVTSALAHLRETFGMLRAMSITKEKITAYRLERLDAGASEASLNYELAILRRMFNLAIDAGKLTTAPSISTKAPDNARAGFFEADDFAAVVKELPSHLKAVMRFAYLTGWRVPSEILTLTWDRVDFEAGEVRLYSQHTKNKKPRTFPFGESPDLAELLRQQREIADAIARERGSIIPNVFHKNGKQIVNYYGAWRAACARAAQPKPSRDGSAITIVARPHLVGRLVHDLRRTAVRNLVRAGVPEGVAMKLTGHKTRSVFERYNITSDADTRAAVAKLDAHLNPSKNGAKKPPKGATGGHSQPRAIGGDS